MRPKLGQERILQAALLLFAKSGYHATSISQIAESAGVSKGLTYNYFSSKEELLLAIVEQASEAIFEVADTLFLKGNYEEALQHFLDQYVISLKTNRDYLSFQLSLLFQPDLRKIVQAPLQRRAEHLLFLTEKMFTEAGVENPKLVARRFVSELDGIALHELSVFKDFPLDEMKDYLFRNYKDLAT